MLIRILDLGEIGYERPTATAGSSWLTWRIIHEAETVGVNSPLTTADTGIWRGRE
jgi:hypothetical protein